MENNLIGWDRNAFEAINSGTANTFFDLLMPMVRNPWFWAPVYMFFAVFLIYNFKEKGFYLIIGALVAFVISDQLSAHVLKQIFMRERPCRDPYFSGAIRMLVPCGGGYSMPSTHATNHFAIALYLITIFPSRVKWVIPFCLLWAFVVCYAQIYVGLHFPLDVIFGGLLGGLIGIIVGTLGRHNFNLDALPAADEHRQTE